jgi:hypothetical protein
MLNFRGVGVKSSRKLSVVRHDVVMTRLKLRGEKGTDNKILRGCFQITPNEKSQQLIP